MKTNVKFLLFLLSLVICLGSFAACGKKNGTKEPPQTDPGTSEVLPNDSEYNYPELDCGGESIRFRSLSWLWDMYIFLDAAETGDKIDQAVYKRNDGLSRRFNCNIEVSEFSWDWDINAYVDSIYNSLYSNIENWDAIYVPVNKRPDMITMGFFKDLNTIEELNLDREWWDKELNDSFELSGSLYFASSPLQLQAFDSAWAMFFNETLMNQHGMQNPRDLVESNTWTLETMDQMSKQIATQNSSPSFYWSDGNGDQIYGISAHPNLPDKLLFASGERFVIKENGEKPKFSADSENFYNVVKKLADILGKEHNLRAASEDMVKSIRNPYGETGGYVYAFVQDRAFLMGAEVKTSRVIQNYEKEVAYGIVPLPKYTADKSYYTPVVETLLTLTIPYNCSNVNRVAQIIDAMSYESYANVLPVYYDQLLYRGYREEDRPVMDILRATRGVDIAYFYGWNEKLAEQVRDRSFDGTAEITGTVSSEKVAISEKISTWMTSLENMKTRT